MAANTHLVELYASGHELEPAALTAIADAIGKSRTLRTVCIGNSSFGDDGTALLAEGLAGNTTLLHLDLENKSVGAEGASALSKALTAGAGLQSLLLARNPLGNTGSCC